jgi:hypothetical protein
MRDSGVSVHLLKAILRPRPIDNDIVDAELMLLGVDLEKALVGVGRPADFQVAAHIDG